MLALQPYLIYARVVRGTAHKTRGARGGVPRAPSPPAGAGAHLPYLKIPKCSAWRSTAPQSSSLKNVSMYAAFPVP